MEKGKKLDEKGMKNECKTDEKCVSFNIHRRHQWIALSSQKESWPGPRILSSIWFKCLELFSLFLPTQRNKLERLSKQIFSRSLRVEHH
jgi:hypothetical protein